ncbi:glycosyltransferase [Mycobacterium deserti]|uniref:Glycosyltransferase n=1 Tax=Mycobacterium deserti TaxID=2978347 RepID=A0ABT2MEZ9_9MYCO|nr:glycosyltransferase [Mycobacterium deserti]MCT7660861.1 glycosyltransferase [Mycobacterium deserti]
MKIAMVSEHASPLAALGGVAAGGQKVQVAEISAALARRGHLVTVYTRRDDPDLPERVDTPQGYSVVHVPAGPAKSIPDDELLGHMGPFAQFLDDQWTVNRPDVVHAHSWRSGIATQLAARHLDLPAVQTFDAMEAVVRRHQDTSDTSSSDRHRIEAMVARSATWVVATCTDEVFELMRMGRSRNRISVVPCGVDLDMFTPDGPTAPRGGRHRIVSVGNSLPGKGFDVVLRALPALPDTELVIVGGPEASQLPADTEVRRLRKLARDLGVGDRVLMYGSVAREGMPAILRSADVVACTPWYEPSGIVALEAMACGVPVVASGVGGMLDTVVHDVTGRLVKPKSTAEVADAIIHLLRDQFLRQSLGAAGRDRARARYSWDRIAADTQRIYDRLEAADCRRQTSAATLSSG